MNVPPFSQSRFARRFALMAACALLSSVSLAVSGAEPRAAPPAPLKLGTVRVAESGAVGVLSDGTRAELTIDSRLQADASRLLRSARPVAGAVLLLEVATGRLLVYEQFTRPGHPIYDVLTSEAPSASVFKLVTTTALFERTSIGPDTSVCFSGGQHGIERQHLERPSRGRCAPFGTALGFSRNAVYAQLATEHLMRDDLLTVAERLGFNSELPFDATASMGTLKLPYNDLEFARAAAGFQDSSLSPLGATHLSYAIALGGRAGRLRLIERAGDYEAPRRRQLLDRVMSANTAWRLTRMMEVTVHSGTSLEAFSNSHGSSYLGSIRVAGKTGTLQLRRSSPTTSWFTGFAPSRKPEVVVTVMLQNDDIWRNKANEVARDMLRSYFQDRHGVSSPFAAPEPDDG